MKGQRRRKCRGCGALYRPDYRNLRHQKYCAKPECRQASKGARQAKWRTSPKGFDYFQGLDIRRLRALIDTDLFEVVQLPYCLVQVEPVDEEIIPFARAIITVMRASTVNWDVNAFVDATPISGPAWI